MDDRKPTTQPGADPHGAAHRVQQFLASFRRRTQQPSPAGADGSAAHNKPVLRDAAESVTSKP